MALDSFLSQLMDERKQKVSIIENLAQVAADEGRDLHDTDLATITNYRSRITKIDEQIDKVSGDLELSDTVKNRVRQLDPSVIARDFTYRSAGEYLYDGLHWHEDNDARTRWQKFHRRAAEHMGYDKDNTIPTAGGFDGLIVAQPTGTVLDPRPSGRPLFNALGVRPITSGTFLRPRIVDPNFESGVGVQAQEKTELASKAWDILSEPVTADVVGGYINISQLLIEMMPSGLDMIVSHMNRRLEWYTEKAAVTEMAKTTASVAYSAAEGSAGLVSAIAEASALVFTNTGEMPTWIAFGPDGWTTVIGTTDLAGRPLLPPVGPVNAMGTANAADLSTGYVSGLRPVPTSAITDGSLYVGNSFGLEAYEKKVPVLSAVEPAVFGRQLSVQSIIAFYRPITLESDTAPEKNGIVKITVGA